MSEIRTEKKESWIKRIFSSRRKKQEIDNKLLALQEGKKEPEIIDVSKEGTQEVLPSTNVLKQEELPAATTEKVVKPTVTVKPTTTTTYYNGSYYTTYYKYYDDSNVGKLPKDLSDYHRLYIKDNDVYTEISTAKRYKVGSLSKIYLIEHIPSKIAVVKLTHEETEIIRTSLGNAALLYRIITAKIEEYEDLPTLGELPKSKIDVLKRMISLEDLYGMQDTNQGFTINRADRKSLYSYRTSTVTKSEDKKKEPVSSTEDTTKETKEITTSESVAKTRTPVIKKSFFDRLRHRPLNGLSKRQLIDLDTDPIESTDKSENKPYIKELKP